MAFDELQDKPANVADLDELADAIGRGAQLWWPSWTEALDMHSAIERRAAKARADAIAERRLMLQSAF